ncbi:alpha/beta fold hydrolase [Cupriavidus necator]|uniref:Alpha/beta hydrolase fold protein n=1 Tax=Cupriavidus pinatubonensis (strain JMP 134 / LMG 1197) TaxID=264198 RepID=Q46PW1_CUPPJ|nr:alpha/beta hydrolase [Cupriavidus necator]
MTTQSISHRSIRLAGTAAAALLMRTTAGHAANSTADSTTARATGAQDIRPALDIGRLDISPDIQLRRMVVRNASAKGTVLLLHGFPETALAWHDIALKLGTDYEVHAFDWPGYGESSRPSADRFSYAPRDYANILKSYVDAAGIDKRNLVIYATDIGALPALLAAIDDPAIARRIIVGDFAPFNRPQYMQERLQGLKDPNTAPAVRAAFNQSRDEILENAFTRGLPATSQYKLSAEYKADLARGWQNGTLTSADAFYHYYAHFTRDQNAFEATLARLQTPVKVVWGEQDIYIRKEMGAELAQRLNAPLHVLSGVGHYPHLQQPEHTIDEVRASFE